MLFYAIDNSEMVSNQTGSLLYLVFHRELSSALVILLTHNDITADIGCKIRLFADDCV